MADLEQRVRELMTGPVARDPRVLEASTGGKSLDGSQQDVNRIVMRAVSGLREAILEIAKDVDELRTKIGE